MTKISQISWNRYKESAGGKSAIAEFKTLNAESPAETVLAIMRKYSPMYFVNLGERDMQNLQHDLSGINLDILTDCAVEKIQNQEDFNLYYDKLLCAYAGIPFGENPHDYPQGQFKGILSVNMLLTTALYMNYPDYCIPNLLPMQFKLLEMFAAKYEIDLPTRPNPSKYMESCLYYKALNECLMDFCRENSITSTAEMAAYLYDYEFSLLREELNQRRENTEMPEAAQAWFLVGDKSEFEKSMDYGFWQASPETRRGDIMVFYEKSPVMAINAVWRAQEDGVVDPFFRFRSNTYIGMEQKTPAISLEELKHHPYFKNHALVHKNFQGGSGWSLNAEDYRQLQQIWAKKGFDCSTLPQLKAHEAPTDIDFTEKEAAVNKYLVLPLLKEMGWTRENGQILEQVVQHVGRGESRTNGRTDVSLHPYGENKKKARVLIEEKFWMKNEREKKDAFDQGESYADLSESKVLVICDKAQIIVFIKKNDAFHFEDGITFYWDEMSNPDKFNTLRKLLA